MIWIEIQITSRPNIFSIPVCDNFIIFNFNIEIKKINTIIDRLQLCLYAFYVWTEFLNTF